MRQSQRSVGLSLLLHVGVFLVIAFGFPILFDRDKDFTPTALTVEIVPIADVTNLVPSKKLVRKEEPKPVKKEKPTPPTKQEEQPKPKPVEPEKPKEKEPEPVPEDPLKKAEKPKEKPKEEPKKKPEPPKEKEKPKEKPKEPEDDFAALMDKLKSEKSSDDAPKDKVKDPTPDSAKTKSDAPYDASKPLSISQIDAIRSQFVKCWRMPAGSRGDYSLAVEVDVALNPDGSVSEAGLGRGQVSRYQSDTAFRAAADSAIRAVHTCSPLQNLPPDKYGSWKRLTLNFDPKELLY